MGAVGKEKVFITNLGREKYFCKVTYWAPAELLYEAQLVHPVVSILWSILLWNCCEKMPAFFFTQMLAYRLRSFLVSGGSKWAAISSLLRKYFKTKVVQFVRKPGRSELTWSSTKLFILCSGPSGTAFESKNPLKINILHTLALKIVK
jgi:hypothetical protein